jgi:hypothetical protein
VSELRSAIDGLRAETLAELPDALLEDDFAELQRASEQLEAERLRRIAEIERRGIHRRDGHLSCAAWLVARFRISWGAARDQTTMARAIEGMPAASRALDEGAISMSAMRVLAKARESHPEPFRAFEDRLVEAARRYPIKELQRVTAFWRQHAEATGEASNGSDQEDASYERRSLHTSVTYEGTVRIDGDLDPETGETVMTALASVLDAEARGRTEPDLRSPPQRRADALGEICRQWLDRRGRPRVAGERPHITLTVNLHDLLAGTPGAEFEHTGPMVPHLAERLACDASVTRVVLGGASQPLDVGRRTPIVPPSMRRAVVVRDRHCRFPGCDRPQSWCDAHHVEHWIGGGPTSIDNLLLLCRRHHRSVHQPGGFGLRLLGGRPVFTRPDGSPLEDRAPP